MNISDILLEFRKTQNITLLECTNMNISNEDLMLYLLRFFPGLNLSTNALYGQKKEDIFL